MEVSGVLSSWLTMPRNSARSRSISSSGVMSWRVTTTETTSPSSERMGVACTRVVTLPPPGTSMTELLGSGALAGRRPLTRVLESIHLRP